MYLLILTKYNFNIPKSSDYNKKIFVVVVSFYAQSRILKTYLKHLTPSVSYPTFYPIYPKSIGIFMRIIMRETDSIM